MNVNYWHIQMSKPEGRSGRKRIDAKEMLQLAKPVIGTGDWVDYQCRYFLEKLNDNSIVCVKDGGSPIALCRVKSDPFKDKFLQQKFYNEHYRYVDVLEFYNGSEAFPQPQGTLNRSVGKHTDTYKFIDTWYKNFLKNSSMNDSIDILKYKKQIILQGPPGTGKTYTAKKMAEVLTGYTEKTITKELIKSKVKVEGTLKNASGKADFYTITKIDDNGITLQSEKSQPWVAKYDKIIEKYKQFENNHKPTNVNGTDPYEIAVAKFLFEKKDQLLHADKPYTLIQFHPSYSYEDFVRGIVAESNGESIEYKNVNKTFGLFAEEALKNYRDSKKDTKTVSTEILLDNYFDEFKEFIFDKIEESNGFYELTENVGLISTDDQSAFRYKGKNDGWLKNGNRMLFKDIIQAYNDSNEVRQDIKKNDKVSGLARQHASYFIRVVNQFQEFIKEKGYGFNESQEVKIELKNFVLIIDEINRANLSSVLGELIYALEYRNEAVESMYAVENSILQNKNQLILPPNLYIIGTMNTADRSVGHIDYAIRRRFAFVDVLPKSLVEDDEIYFNTEGFNTIAKLFNEANVSSEFDVNDVQIGHSYFIAKKSEAKNESERDAIFKMKMDYEVVPILEEYVKDGILIGKVDGLSIKDYVKSLK
ncbi:AAA family ATPase [Aequorivita sp. CIP111184]|uniref:AAA family ATPase n=1 Tax=Aequorivita sp. CIP111184 TaxID=2211356 RepID=UPI000DBBCAD8|nr:AAA family ATPase [Aequorivita sp. CIP111184]SRX56129.1 5-methylcytosine-specific restriction enzyme B [Aequorivita sp. CIP111184]